MATLLLTDRSTDRDDADLDRTPVLSHACSSRRGAASSTLAPPAVAAVTPHRQDPGMDPAATRRPPVAHRAPAAVYCRRRVLAGALAVAIAWAGVGLGSEVLGRMTGTDGGLSPVGATGEPVPYVVQPGDTWWDLAAEVAPGEDPRPVVDALIEANGGATLQVGQRILLPG